MVKEYFIAYEQQFPEQRSELRRISLALRRNGIETMPELYQMYRDNRKQLLQIRSIGEKSVRLIGKLCSVYEMELFPGLVSSMEQVHLLSDVLRAPMERSVGNWRIIYCEWYFGKILCGSGTSAGTKAI